VTEAGRSRPIGKGRALLRATAWRRRIPQHLATAEGDAHGQPGSGTSFSFGEARRLLALKIAGVAMLYFAGAQIGLMYAVVGGAVSLVWPPSGIALVAMLHLGYRAGLGVALGSFLSNVSVGIPIPVALGIAAGATLEAVVGTFLLQRCAAFRCDLGRRRDVVALILFAAALSTTISASIGVAALAAGGLVPLAAYASTCLKWWLGDMMGVLVVAPPLLVLLAHARPVVSPLKALEAIWLTTAIGVVSLLIFGSHELAGHGYFPAALAIFPFIIWAALRFDHWGACLATLAVSIVAIWGTTQETGPFAASDAVESLVRWSAFVNVLAVSGLLLAASHAEACHAQAELKASHDGLEQRVRERTAELLRTNAELHDEMAERRRLEAMVIRLSDEQQRILGSELHDGLGQHLTSIGLYGASLASKLRTQRTAPVHEAERIVTLVQQAAEMTRSIARGLYPVALESAGLAAALHDLAERTRSLNRMDCIVRATPPAHAAEGDSLVAINLYRIAQEAINNALKYSQARHIWIDLECTEGTRRLTISDDGVGIAPEAIEHGTGLGLHSLRHRSRLLGGSCAIARNAHGGTTVAVSYPASVPS
jgi:signal transduction histidine kinase